METRKTLKIYTQEEFDAACEASYAQGHEDGYDAALDNDYLNSSGAYSYNGD
ncbi:MAG: hypothetical protein ACTSPB_17650 [Candidatus Thorarchaeota archaeon]